ncbi:MULTISPECIES: FAD-dependent monooxygenase [Rhodococcus]|uniref:FAD-dependent monooxygenase n=1 Tax=Rhodococcus qingshengii JCM 15477 TaxID=1303681 RepID=A0AB38RMV2_RHOSG|nr:MULTISPECIES: FAD-dependent monooxygenase [Rhodococcus]MDA3635179.1 FAD-dependent monooxygenase [Rhodococcus sp. C-2]UPU46475.1 FAD-dependent monooxygenase [Rhodococcus qingshengii JCM 15477]SCC66812.1 2-polyprenyl-6-methoxyphenol hydroxylase [Rhodococcus qingshengii]
MNEFDVVVVGAGPVGFTLAIDLGRRGVRTLLVEKDPTTKEWPKMDRSNARTMEFYRRLGIADEVRAAGYPADGSMDVFIVTRLSDPPLVKLEYPSVAEHRATIAATTDASEPLEPYQLVAQNDLEPVLKRVAESTPNVTVRFGYNLVDFIQDDEGVTVTLEDLAGARETVRTGYLSGCDGGISTIRKKLGIKLEGQGSIRQLRQVTFRSDELYDKIPIGKGRHYYVADAEGSAFVVQGSRKDFTLNIAIDVDADLAQAVRDRVGFDFDFTIRNSTNWKLHLLLAERYRDERVLLAGDAVHLVIPTGGLGMNTGVGDAIDLAWKLAGTVQGWGGPGLLDSYETERRKVGARNVQASGWAAQGMSLWRDLVTPEITEDTPAGATLRSEVGAAANIHHRRVHEMIGVEWGYSYAGSDLIAHEDDNITDWDTTTYTAHTRPGVRVPHIWLQDGRAMQDALGQDYTFIDLTGSADTTAVEADFARLGAPLEVLRIDDPNVRAAYDCSLLLVRPDLHVFWRGDVLPEDVDHWAEQAVGHLTQAERDAMAQETT